MTLAFNWATNANYSTGPDVGSPTRVNPASTANGFISGVIAAPQHINFLFDAVGDQLAKAVDGIGGGTYAMLAPLRFNGDAVQIGEELDILAGASIELSSTASINVNAGADINVDAGAQIDVAGNANVLSGGNVNLASGASVLSGSGAVVRLEDSEDLTINANAELYILTMTPQGISLSADIPTWQPLNPPCAGFVQTDVSAAFLICFPLNLPPGDSIVSAIVTVNGAGAGAGHAAQPSGGNRLLVSIVSVDQDGAVTTLATRADQSGSAGAYDVSHGINVASGNLDSGSLPRTVSDSLRYYITVAGEHGGDAVAATTVVTGIQGVCTARSYRSAVMVY